MKCNVSKFDGANVVRRYVEIRRGANVKIPHGHAPTSKVGGHKVPSAVGADKRGNPGRKWFNLDPPECGGCGQKGQPRSVGADTPARFARVLRWRKSAWKRVTRRTRVIAHQSDLRPTRIDRILSLSSATHPPRKTRVRSLARSPRNSGASVWGEDLQVLFGLFLHGLIALGFCRKSVQCVACVQYTQWPVTARRRKL